MKLEIKNQSNKNTYFLFIFHLFVYTKMFIKNKNLILLWSDVCLFCDRLLYVLQTGLWLTIVLSRPPKCRGAKSSIATAPTLGRVPRLHRLMPEAIMAASVQKRFHMEAGLWAWKEVVVMFYQALPPKIIAMRTMLSTQEPLEGTLEPGLNHNTPQNLWAVQSLFHHLSSW